MKVFWEVAMTRDLLSLLLAILGISTAAAEEPLSIQEALLARAKSLELDTPYVPPPGDPLEHHTAGFAKVMCSAVFITGLDPEFAAENVGYFTSPYAERAKVGKPVIDRGQPGGSHHASLWSYAHCKISRLSRLRHTAGRRNDREVHAGCREERVAGPRHAAMADGRRTGR